MLIEVDDLAAARRVLGDAHVQEEGGALRVTLDGTLTPAELNRSLVEAGIAVSRLEPARATLEETFLVDHVATGEPRMRLDPRRGPEARPAARPDDVVCPDSRSASLLIVETVLVVLHAVNAAHHGPAGGPSNFRGAAETVALFGTLTAVLIGATAGSQDVGNGVFRDLVVTGRRRSTLFNVRAPGRTPRLASDDADRIRGRDHRELRVRG